MQPADRVLHVELRLEAVRDGFRVAHQQQVIGHLGRVGRAGAGAVAGEEAGFGFAGPQGAGAVVEAETLAGLAAAQLDQGASASRTRGIGAVRENDAPAGLVELFGVDAFTQAVVRQPALGAAVLELGQVFGRRGRPAQAAGELFAAHRRQAVGAGAAVDAVEIKELRNFVVPPVTAARHCDPPPRAAKYSSIS